MLYLLAGFAGGLIATVITHHRYAKIIKDLDTKRGDYLLKYNQVSSELAKIKHKLKEKVKR
jgi:hypothetical protein